MIYPAWSIPAPLPCPWPLKPLSSARTSRARLTTGQLELTIQHDLIRGVTPAMLAWWLSHVDDTMEYDGKTYPRNRVWHPFDHVYYKDLTVGPDGSAGAGTRRHIVEVLGRDPQYLLNIVGRVVHLDETGIVVATERAGIQLGRLGMPMVPVSTGMGTLEHTFRAAPTGTLYESRMVLGMDTFLGRAFLNRYVLPRVVMPEPMAQAWLKHNVEEVGNFERFLPALYDRWLEGGLRTVPATFAAKER